ncbi:uncharacterized protein LOC119997506 [Tripterygium wilfordii]|nr:uncharacterized protein LOC119997506 [Tripterygium wilfordii]
MGVDDEDYSCKKPGAVPFKWEIRPGVPKIQHDHHKPQPPPLSPPASPFLDENHHSLPTTPRKLKPPPAVFSFLPQPELRTRSFLSTPRTRSNHWRFEQPVPLRPDAVSPGCFPSPLLRRKENKRRVRKPDPAYEPDCNSELETLSRWSVSSRKTFSPFRDSTSSYSPYQSSPRPVSDTEWAGFGLF